LKKLGGDSFIRKVTGVIEEIYSLETKEEYFSKRRYLLEKFGTQKKMIKSEILRRYGSLKEIDFKIHVNKYLDSL